MLNSPIPNREIPESAISLLDSREPLIFIQVF